MVVVVKREGELHWEKKLLTRKGISCRNLSAFICENVWWKYLSGVLCCMEVKHGLYKKRIFGDLKHLKCGYGGIWWKYHGRTKQMKKYCNWHRKRNDGHSQKSTEKMVRSHPQTRLITEDNVRRLNTREKRLWKTKNNVLGLVNEDGGR